MLISADYQRQQMQLHENPNYGVASEAVADLVASIISTSRPKTLCDYGAGKKRLEKALLRLGVENFPEYYPYDPAFPEYGEPKAAELVCCIDVLEHIEPECLEAVLSHLASLTGRLAFITVHTAPAQKTLPDGRNAHLIIKPKEWWLTKLGSYFEIIWSDDQLFKNEIILVGTAREIYYQKKKSENSQETAPSIHVLIPGYHRDIESLTRHPLASIRMRSAVLAKTAAALGWKVVLGERFDTKPDVLYVGKIPANDIEQREPAWLRYISKSRGTGTHVIIDYTDHYGGFSGPMTNFYINAMPIADEIIVPSAYMRTLLDTTPLGAIHVIPDLCEISPRPFLAPGKSPWRALWFGSPSNIDYLIKFMGSSANRKHLRQVNIVTNAIGMSLFSRGASSWISRIDAPELKYFDWSIDNLIAASKLSDIVLIPSDREDPRKAGVSENRLITAMSLGMISVATTMAAYSPYKEFFVALENDWSEKVNHVGDAWKDSNTASDSWRIKYSYVALAQKWHLLIESAISQRRNSLALKQFSTFE